MKKVHLLLFALALLAVPFTAQAQTSCFKYSCDFIQDGGFYYGGQYWAESNTTYPSVPSCLWDASPTTLAQPGNSGYVSQTFFVNGAYNSYTLDFRAFLQNDTENWYDQLKVTVTNLTTGQAEAFYLRGTNFNSTCNLQSFNLTKDYDNAQVRVRFDVSYSTLGTWQVDDVAFWGNYY